MCIFCQHISSIYWWLLCSQRSGHLLRFHAEMRCVKAQFSGREVRLSPPPDRVSALSCGADKCGGNIEIHSADYLTSPGYPSAYPPSQQCVWVITAPERGQKILINFNPHFDLEDRDCK